MYVASALFDDAYDVVPDFRMDVYLPNGFLQYNDGVSIDNGLYGVDRMVTPLLFDHLRFARKVILSTNLNCSNADVENYNS